MQNDSSKFKAKVLKVVQAIPRGETLTYKDIAKIAGSPKAFRAVGNILNKNYNPGVPCHRVIRSDGKLGGYNKGELEKLKRLTVENAL